jgi:uncharacterized membrane protein YbaN (DUF454 family)
MLRTTLIIFWRAVALLSLALGIIGAFLPLLPTVPFVIGAAWAASKGWPQLEVWLLNHPSFGDHIRQWRSRGAVPRRAKYLAIFMMSCSAIMVQFLPMPYYADTTRIVLPLFLLGVACWLWRRPE